MNIFRDKVTMEDLNAMLEAFPAIVPKPAALRRRLEESGGLLVPELLLWSRMEKDQAPAPANNDGTLSLVAKAAHVVVESRSKQITVTYPDDPQGPTRLEALEADVYLAPTKARWSFNTIQPTETLVAVDPRGVEYVVRGGKMDSTAGEALLNAMVKALT